MSDAVATTVRYCWRVGGRVHLVDGERCPECGDANHKELPSGTCGRFVAGYPCVLPTDHAGYHSETVSDGAKTHADGCALVQFPGGVCDCVDVARELIAKAKDATLAERAAVVAWLREVSEVYDRNGNGCAAGASYDIADAIERGEHVKVDGEGVRDA